MPETLPAFTPAEFHKAHLFLATQVAEMMGRKLEEGDWAKVYAAAKGMPLGTWSNVDIDVSYGNLGVEQKMICRRSNDSLLGSCGTRIMHPAGTRAIRIPSEPDATLAARDVLRQYGELVDRRTEMIRILHAYNHGQLTGSGAISAMQQLGYSANSAKSALPKEKTPVGDAESLPDMRMGWLLWQESLREFLYFEERMVKPKPAEYFAEWRERPDGRRRGSRNLWVYESATGEKVYSITTEAGAKIQPYFKVPPPSDPNVNHFVVQGEPFGDSLVRVWLTPVTAEQLRAAIGSLDPEAIARAIERAKAQEIVLQRDVGPFAIVAIEVLIPASAYAMLAEIFEGVSDEHNFKQLVEILQLSAETHRSD